MTFTVTLQNTLCLQYRVTSLKFGDCFYINIQLILDTGEINKPLTHSSLAFNVFILMSAVHLEDYIFELKLYLISLK